jgi:hypothetical protein
MAGIELMYRQHFDAGLDSDANFVLREFAMKEQLAKMRRSVNDTVMSVCRIPLE